MLYYIFKRDMKIYLIRHWESFINKSNYLKDDSWDLGLTENWIIQVKNIISKVNLEWKYKIFSSPYKRTIETSKILFPYENISIIHEFKELDKWFSKWPFKNFSWDEWNVYFSKFEKEISKKDWKYPEWESIDILSKRVLPKFLYLVDKYIDYDSIYIISHNWVIKVILMYILNFEISYRNLRINNASIIKVDFNNWYFSIIL
jgi:broad specificity phosphatase PhoE